MNNEIFLVITIDTEIDKSINWRIPENETFLSVLKGIPNRLTPLFNQFGAKPTYLLSSEIIENDECVGLLKGVENCELGTHLHGDLLEPQRRVFELANAETSDMQCSYPYEIEYRKLSNLTNLFKVKFGYRPSSFRAGRFGAGNNTILLLEELGYRVDSSITPGIDWNFPEGRANFLEAKEQPYFPSKQNILKEGDSKVLEVPISIVSPSFRRFIHSFGKIRELHLVKKITNYAFPACWLRPSRQSSREMIHVINYYLKRYGENDHLVLNMMFHSMEIIPKASPYTRTEDECLSFLNRIKRVLQYCVSTNALCLTLSELYPIFARNVQNENSHPY